MPIIVKTVSVHYGRKLNLGDYSSATVECTLWADVTEEDAIPEGLDASMHALWEMAKANVKAQLVPLDREAKGKATVEVLETFMGLPIEKGK